MSLDHRIVLRFVCIFSSESILLRILFYFVFFFLFYYFLSFFCSMFILGIGTQRSIQTQWAATLYIAYSIVCIPQHLSVVGKRFFIFICKKWRNKTRFYSVVYCEQLSIVCRRLLLDEKIINLLFVCVFSLSRSILFALILWIFQFLFGFGTRIFFSFPTRLNYQMHCSNCCLEEANLFLENNSIYSTYAANNLCN